MKDNNTREFRITRVFNAPRKAVWRALTEPEQVMKWWGPAPFTSPSAKIDLRVGGAYLYCMRSPDGKDFWSGGTYKEIVPLEKLVCLDHFTNEKGEVMDPVSYGMPAAFPKESAVTITLEEEKGNKTRLTILYVVESDAMLKAMRDVQMKEGWESSLDRLAESVE